MKLVSIELGRYTRAFAADEVRPQDGIYLPNLIEALCKKYGFTGAPPPNLTASQKGLSFQHGSMARNGERTNIVSLTIFSDAMTVEAFHTDNARAVSDDVMSFLIETQKFRSPETGVREIFHSYVVADFSRPVSRLLGVFERTKSSIAAALAGTYGRRFNVDFVSMGLGVDPMELSPSMELLNPEFSIVRRVQRPFSENRFFCSASLPTDIHIELLKKLDYELQER